MLSLPSGLDREKLTDADIAKIKELHPTLKTHEVTRNKSGKFVSLKKSIAATKKYRGSKLEMWKESVMQARAEQGIGKEFVALDPKDPLYKRSKELYDEKLAVAKKHSKDNSKYQIREIHKSFRQFRT